MTTKMSESEVQAALSGLPDWSEVSDGIQRTFHFADFREAMAFANKVAEYAERVQHHPDILIRYNKVTLTLTTHSEGGLTEKDFKLAAQFDRLM